MPFDRLISAVDRWAGQGKRSDVYAQIGEAAYRPKNMRWDKFVSPRELREIVQSADAIVAHAGMGTVLTALELGKPIIVMPRRGALNETRNDHQVATARQLGNQGLVTVAWDEHELVEQLETRMGQIRPVEKISRHASPALCQAVGEFIGKPRAGRVDGVICFGGVDWWYHNRGHYDIQMMREFSRRMPVLYVNSIGMRTPRLGEGKVFLNRVARKLKSWRQGFQHVREDFGVLSPFSIPKFHRTSWARKLLVEQVREAAAWMGIQHPLIWVACPPAAEVIDRIPSACVVYQRTDRYEHFQGVDVERIRGYDVALKQQADLTVFCSTSVYEDEAAECVAAAFVDHGVDYQHFALAGDREAGSEPADVTGIGRPRVGFVGGIDAQTFDPELFVKVASKMPECSFVLVGACSLPNGWCGLENVHSLGRKPYDQVADYMAACDVLIMPWNRSPWIKSCNPVKLKEYLAVARPVVSTPFDELNRYAGFVSIATDADEFVERVRQALEAPVEKAVMRRRVENETWAAKAADVIERLQVTGIEFRKVALEPELASSTSRETDQATAPIPAMASVTEDGVARVDSGAPVPRPSRGYWRPYHIVSACVLAFLGWWVTSDAWSDIFRLAAKDEESSHIWLVLPIAAWLVWVRKEQLLFSRRSGAFVGPLLVGLGWLSFSVGDVQLYQSLWHLGAILITVGCAISVLGSDVLRRFWPAFAVLLFLIPVPGILRQQIAGPMQTITAELTAVALQTIGQPVTLSGKVLVLNEVSVGIAEACNGLRMVFALVLVCFLYAFSSEFSTRTRVLIMLASPVVAVAVNVVRLVPTVCLYGYSDEKTATLFHDVSGWAMMPIALFGMIGVGSLFRWAFQPEQERRQDLPAVSQPTVAGRS